ncbi:hypothetical protein ACH4VR_40350 [Streptomyces sp. NPDC020883]
MTDDQHNAAGRQGFLARFIARWRHNGSTSRRLSWEQAAERAADDLEGR